MNNSSGDKLGNQCIILTRIMCDDRFMAVAHPLTSCLLLFSSRLLRDSSSHIRLQLHFSLLHYVINDAHYSVRTASGTAAQRHIIMQCMMAWRRTRTDTEHLTRGHQRRRVLRRNYDTWPFTTTLSRNNLATHKTHNHNHHTCIIIPSIIPSLS
jgi:hypothetical protein